MIRLLLVEDKTDEVVVFQDALASRGFPVTLTLARSREGAIDHLRADHFDLLVCDLKIPTVDGGLDTEVEHGLAVYEFALANVPGLPAVFFSAFGAPEVLEQNVVPMTRQADPFGAGIDELMLQLKHKGRIAECLDVIEHVVEEVGILDALVIDDGAIDPPLSPQDQRLVRLCCRLYGAQSAVLAVLHGGLSGARTLQVDAEDESHVPRLHAVLKLDTVEEIRAEATNYDRLAGVAGPGLLANRGMTITAGACGRGAIVYALAGTHVSLFRALADDGVAGAAVVARLEERMRQLSQGAPVETATVREIRRRVCSDESLAAVEDLMPAVDWRRAEEVEVQVTRALVHGDLHGSNILIGTDGIPVLIDFGSVAEQSAAFDPVLLELSAFFHPYGRTMVSQVPELEALEWCDLDAFLAGCPVPEYVEACRRWTRAVADNEGEVLPVAYSWAVRQLAFPDSNHDFARALIECCVDSLLGLADP